MKKMKYKDSWRVSFLEREEGIDLDEESNGPIVVTFMIEGYDVRRIMVDIGSAIVIDNPSNYNAIFGRPLMKKAMVIVAPFCLHVKFPTLSGDGYIQAD
ncbi:hypothetical protein V6N13_064703 [Hibiscus sabdariffa]